MVRFQDWNSKKPVDPPYSPNDGSQRGMFRTTFSSISSKFQRTLESGYERIKKSWKSYSIDRVVGKRFCSTVLDPQGQFLQKWNKIFVLACVIAVSLDPLFFYVPVIDDDNKCLDKDRKMEITAGDGPANQGQLFEALNISALWDLPVILMEWGLQSGELPRVLLITSVEIMFLA